MKKALDLFAGAGGWDVAAAPLGWSVDRVENWAPANATAEAAGFGKPIHEDVRTFSTLGFPRIAYDLVIASPSCKKFSMAGDGRGRYQRNLIVDMVKLMGHGRTIESFGTILDPDAALTLEPLRIILECEPRAVALEQAPSVLPIWEAYADVLRARGYAVWTGVVDAVDYGVPQNRKRAVLLARNDGIRAYQPATGLGLNSMRTELGWPDAAFIRSNYGTGGDPRNRGIRYATQPSFAITGRADRNKVHFPDGTVRNLAHAEAAALQTFPDGYPFQGNVAEIGQQIGNAVPPRLAEALLRVLL